MAEQTASTGSTTITTNVVRLIDDDAQQTLSDSLWRRALRQLRRDKLTLTAMVVLLLIIVLTLGAPPITQHILKVDPEKTNPAIRLLPPGSPGHVLGTDDLGRDYLARLLYGGRVSLAIGFSGAVLTLLIGISLGLISGYYGSKVDDIMNWVITTLDSIPSIYLLILVSAVLQPGPGALILILSLLGWTGTTRLIRGQTISLRHHEYVISAQAVGASAWRIMFQHILPNIMSLILISIASSIAGLILVESTLSYLKLGVQPPHATWGNMLSNAERFFYNGPHLAIVSGFLIFITVLCLYLIGDGLRDAFDPRIVSGSGK